MGCPADQRRCIRAYHPEEREQVLSELKRFAEDLNLTEQQKEQLRSCLVESREKLAECITRNPDMSGIDIADQLIEHRAEIRQRVVNFLSPDQLIKWDADALQHRLVVLAGRDDGPV